MHSRNLGKLAAEGREFSDLRLPRWIVAEFPAVWLEHARWLTFSTNFVLSWKEFGSVLEGALRTALVDGGGETLRCEVVKVLHRLNVEEVH